MDSSFGVLDAFAFVVFAVLIFVAVFIVVELGKLPGNLARQWNHPQASAITAMSWIGIATGGLLWPIAFIWAFINSSASVGAASRDNKQPQSYEAAESDVASTRSPLRKISSEKVPHS